MSQSSDPLDSASVATCHEVVTALQILILTAELLAIELRDDNRTAEQVQVGSRALRAAMQRVTSSAQRVPSRQVMRDDGSSPTLAEVEPLVILRVFVDFIAQHAMRANVERDVLAEYVDELYARALELIERIDQPLVC